MRTKFLKFGMPIMLFMMAIVFAFATENAPIEDDSLLISGYIFENNECKSARDCNNLNGPLCKQGVFQVYMTNLGGTACITELTHKP